MSKRIRAKYPKAPTELRVNSGKFATVQAGNRMKIVSESSDEMVLHEGQCSRAWQWALLASSRASSPHIFSIPADHRPCGSAWARWFWGPGNLLASSITVNMDPHEKKRLIGAETANCAFLDVLRIKRERASNGVWKTGLRQRWAERQSNAAADC